MKIVDLVRLPRLCLTVIVVLALPASGLADTNGEQLRRMMAEIALMNNQMAQRKSDAVGIRESLSAKLKEIEAEAADQVEAAGVKSEKQARQIPRLWFDLTLMGEIEAYIDRYTQRINYYRVACDRLSYLYQQADDDLKIVNTLAGMKIDALISQTEKVLDGYLDDAQTLVIQPESLTVAPPQEMWALLNAKR